MNTERTLLVADDNPDHRRFYRQALTPYGNVVEATNGQEALESVMQKRPDLIVLDYMMPGMSGADVLQNLRQNVTTKNLPVIVVTGVSDKESVLKLLQSGASDYVVKPVTPGKLRERVQRLLAPLDSNGGAPGAAQAPPRPPVETTKLAQDEDLLWGRRQAPAVSVEAQPPASSAVIKPARPEVPVGERILEVFTTPPNGIAELGRGQDFKDLLLADPRMSVQFVKYVNSGAFSKLDRCNDAARGAEILGPTRVAQFAVTMEMRRAWPAVPTGRLNRTRLLRHSVQTALACVQLSEIMGFCDEMYFFAGLFHDVGKIALETADPDRYRQMLEYAATQKLSELEAEQEVFGIGHPEAGGIVLTAWGVPTQIVTGAAEHEASPQGIAGHLCFLANRLAHHVDSQAAMIKKFVQEVPSDTLNALGLDEGQIIRAASLLKTAELVAIALSNHSEP